MDELVRWLGERLDEDERIARAADTDLSNLTSWIEIEYPETKADEAHAMRHSPARVLREIDAKRQRISIHSGPHECASYDYVSKEINPCQWVDGDEACTTLRLETVPYVDRPGYREEWRPQLSG